MQRLLTSSVAVSIADTVSLLAQVTYSRWPLGLSAIPVGCSPTSIVLTRVLVAVSTTDTVPLAGMPVRGSTTIGNIPSVTSVGPGTRPPQLLTYTFDPSAEMTVVYGWMPTATRVTVPRRGVDHRPAGAPC